MGAIDTKTYCLKAQKSELLKHICESTKMICPITMELAATTTTAVTINQSLTTTIDTTIILNNFVLLLLCKFPLQRTKTATLTQKQLSATQPVDFNFSILICNLALNTATTYTSYLKTLLITKLQTICEN